MTTNNMLNTPEPFALSAGGTGANLTASNGAIPYSSPTAIALLAAGTSGQLFQSTGNSEPQWTIATYPTTIASGQLLFGSSANVVGQFAPTNNSVLTFSGVGALTAIALTDGQLAIGSAIGSPVAATITAGAGINILNGHNSITATNNLSTYATTATAAATTTLIATSAYQQFFTGSTTQTVLLPVTSTLALGQAFYIVNNSSGVVTVQSSGGNTIQAMAANTVLLVTCILISGTTAASWNGEYLPNWSQVVPNFTTPSITFNPSTQGIVGTTTNDNASSGYVGEYVYAEQLTPQALTTNTPLNVISISLTAGDWDVNATAVFAGNFATVLTYALCSISATSATIDPNFNAEFSAGSTTITGAAPAIVAPLKRISIASTTTVYLVAQAGFTISTYSVYGNIQARRVR